MKGIEIILITLKDFQCMPYSFLDCYFRDGWEIKETNYEAKVVVFAREIYGWENGSRIEASNKSKR